MGRLGPLLTSQEPVFGNGLSGVESPGSFGPVSCPKCGICCFESVDYPKVSNEFQGSFGFSLLGYAHLAHGFRASVHTLESTLYYEKHESQESQLGIGYQAQEYDSREIFRNELINV